MILTESAQSDISTKRRKSAYAYNICVQNWRFNTPFDQYETVCDLAHSKYHVYSYHLLPML